ncbi:MAG: alpha/beta fold hydrolase [Stappiaceae bacterium]
MPVKPLRISFDGAQGAKLAARLDLPAGPVAAYALFAHCFTCSKDVLAARRVAEELTRHGIAVLRFDFTGLGASKGEFASTNFSSNVKDLHLAVDFLRQNYEAPKILIGHSLGGAAVLSAAGDINEIVAVATIGAPADASHVAHNFQSDIETIEASGEANVCLAGREFTIQKQFLDDLKGQKLKDRIASMKAALMVLHSPVDDTVGIENASEIFMAAKHPKSFVSLDSADHLLSNEKDASYAAGVIAAWARRYVGETEQISDDNKPDDAVLVSETGQGKFQNMVTRGQHRYFADEPVEVGGLNTGPSPYDLLAASLGTCTSMTLRLYAEHKKLDAGRISVSVTHEKVHASDCVECVDALKEKGGKIDRFERAISIEGDLDQKTRQRMLEIADKCPVHRTLEAGAAVVTNLVK